ncbi:hypothetical protein B0H14DRAFT_3588678 [Mycena olivaceomarginata]|nr:hypothetical protein B0H14DRAFT_3588678 [Mycena olivaceomarginata]
MPKARRRPWSVCGTPSLGSLARRVLAAAEASFALADPPLGRDGHLPAISPEDVIVPPCVAEDLFDGSNAEQVRALLGDGSFGPFPPASMPPPAPPASAVPESAFEFMFKLPASPHASGSPTRPPALAFATAGSSSSMSLPELLPPASAPPVAALSSATASSPPLADSSRKRRRDDEAADADDPSIRPCPPKHVKIVRDEKRKSGYRAARRGERAEQQSADRQTWKTVTEKRLREVQQVIFDWFTAAQHKRPVVSAGYFALNDKTIEIQAAKEAAAAQSTSDTFTPYTLPERREHHLDEFNGPGWETIPYEGRPKIFVDRLGRIDADVAQPVAAKLDETRRNLDALERTDGDARRGASNAVRVGYTLSRGNPAPTWSKYDSARWAILCTFLFFGPFLRILGFTDLMFFLIAPHLHAFYQTTMAKFYTSPTTPNMLSALKKFVFASIMLNLGPRTVTFPHLDLVYHHRHRHLILWDLKRVIEFPPGTSIAIPSAIFRHSNVSIATPESQASIVQYTGANIFRWVENDFYTDTQLSSAGRRAARAHVKTRFQEGIKLWSTADEFTALFAK